MISKTKYQNKSRHGGTCGFSADIIKYCIVFRHLVADDKGNPMVANEIEAGLQQGLRDALDVIRLRCLLASIRDLIEIESPDPHIERLKAELKTANVRITELEAEVARFKPRGGGWFTNRAND